MPSENELNKNIEDSRSQGPDPQGFDFNHPTYCEIIENIHASVFRLLNAGRHDAETLLDDDEAIEHVLCKKIDMAAEQLARLFEESGRDDGYAADDIQKPDAGAGQWIPCSERLPTEYGRTVIAEDASGRVVPVTMHHNGEGKYFTELNSNTEVKAIRWQPLPTGLTRHAPPEQESES